jgi:hypothetical protein
MTCALDVCVKLVREAGGTRTPELDPLVPTRSFVCEDGPLFLYESRHTLSKGGE